MDWILKYLAEALYLWLTTAAIVVVASIVHYLIASGELKDLQARSKDQKGRPEPEVYREPVLDR
jgi:hypothetical protein